MEPFVTEPLDFNDFADHMVRGTAADGSAASGTVGQNSWVLFTNEAVYTLPETGGAGTFPFAVGGLLSAAAAVLLLRNRKKRGKEDPPSS